MDNFTAAVTRLETLLAKEDNGDDDKEPPKDEDDSEEKAKKALDTLKNLGYDVDALKKGTVDRPESAPVQKGLKREPPKGAKMTAAFVEDWLKQTERA